MVRRFAERVSVYDEKGSVLIVQEGPHGDDDAIVQLSPDQVDSVIEWLKEAKASALAERDGGVERQSTG